MPIVQNRALIRRLSICAGLMLAALTGAGGAAAKGFHTLYDFCAALNCGDGGFPFYSLTMDPSGNLYGVTQYDGAHKMGVAYELIHRPGAKTGRLRTLYHFCALSNCTDGAASGGLIMDVAGNLYGVTYDGGTAGAGTVYELMPNAKRREMTLKTLYSFCSRDSGCLDGQTTSGALTYAGAETGSLYDGTSPLFGAAQAGGKGFGGVVFSLSPKPDGHWGLKVLHAFCEEAGCPDGAKPAGDLTIDASGNLYGATLGYPPEVNGGIFTLSPGSQDQWTLTALYRFCQQSGCADGSNPNGGLARDSAGNLFGTTASGGAHNKGTIFEIPGVNAETVLYSFCSQANCADGSYPQAGVFLDDQGSLFGTTNRGGSQFGDRGILYKWHGSLTVLHNFCSEAGCADGYNPQAPVIMDSAGTLFGTTTKDNVNGGGTIFELVR